jgi:mannose-6-phosphate isomerase-like protein (cupin superfamily)
MKSIHESNIPEIAVPGRFLRWAVQNGGAGLGSDYLSCCVMRVMPGETVKPAHSHPDGEEMLYFVEGQAKVYVDGVIRSMGPGSIVVFEKDSVHMVRNAGKEELKVVCFFAPPANLGAYVFHPEVEFDQGVEE